MKKYLFLITCLFIATVGFAQNNPPLVPFTKITINTVSTFTDPYTVSGIVNDFTSNWNASDIAAGDSVYLIDGSNLRIFYVQSISSAVGPNFTMVINDINDTGDIPPADVGALFRNTANYDFPNFVAGISEQLQSLILNSPYSY